ncbi:hypothetical protein PENSPDRAFT_662278 [Peniophora sp. CONT]|nr:hypothetical protein PENSPDRAFT_662278 [Peniophora sp. CONT]
MAEPLRRSARNKDAAEPQPEPPAPAAKLDSKKTKPTGKKTAQSKKNATEGDASSAQPPSKPRPTPVTKGKKAPAKNNAAVAVAAVEDVVVAPTTTARGGKGKRKGPPPSAATSDEPPAVANTPRQAKGKGKAPPPELDETLEQTSALRGGGTPSGDGEDEESAADGLGLDDPLTDLDTDGKSEREPESEPELEDDEPFFDAEAEAAEAKSAKDRAAALAKIKEARTKRGGVQQIYRPGEKPKNKSKNKRNPNRIAADVSSGPEIMDDDKGADDSDNEDLEDEVQSTPAPLSSKNKRVVDEILSLSDDSDTDTEEDDGKNKKKVLAPRKRQRTSEPVASSAKNKRAADEIESDEGEGGDDERESPRKVQTPAKKKQKASAPASSPIKTADVVADPAEVQGQRDHQEGKSPVFLVGVGTAGDGCRWGMGYRRPARGRGDEAPAPGQVFAAQP